MNSQNMYFMRNNTPIESSQFSSMSSNQSDFIANEFIAKIEDAFDQIEQNVVINKVEQLQIEY